MSVWIVLLIVAAILIFLLFSSVLISFEFKHNEMENKAEIDISYLFIKKTIDLKKSEAKKDKLPEVKEKEMPDRGLSFYRNLYNVLKKDISELLEYLLKKAVSFEKLEIKTDFGYKEPAVTGIMTGTQYAFFYNIMAYFHHNFKVRDWNIEVNPDFEREKFLVHSSCILKMKIVHIINVLIRGLKILLKIKKEGKKGRKK